MARHRNIRTLDYDEEYHEYYDEFSRSVDDDFCISPNTANQYLLGDFSDSENRLIDVTKERHNSFSGDKDDQEVNRTKLYSCVEAIQDVVGETIPEDEIVAAVRKSNYNVESALDRLLNRTKSSSTVAQGKAFVEDVNRLIPNSKLFEALATKYNSDNNIDFNEYNLKRYIKEYCNTQKATYENRKQKAFEASSVLEDASRKNPTPVSVTPTTTMPAKSKALNVSNATHKVPTHKVDSTRNSHTSEINKLRGSTVNVEKQVATPSPLRNVKNIKQKSADEITKLYEQKGKREKLHLNMVVVGHVDAGKSTIMGHLLSLLGKVSQKSMHKREVEAKKAGKASFMYAWVLDETQEERSRGITIDLGQYHFSTTHREVTILDAPGHKDFIPNMIGGATKADVAVLVVDATNGEFETGFESGGQTQEHILLLRSFGVTQLAVAINKLDNVQFNQERYLEIVNKIRKFLKQVGFKETNVHYIPCSGLTGDNLIVSSSNSLFSWYSDSTLIEVIDSFLPNERMITKPFRMAINDIFKGPTSGICLSGKIDYGFVETNQKLVISPLNEYCSVKAILIEEESCSEAFAGDVVTLNVTLTEGVEISIGNVLCDINSPCSLATKFEARVVIFANVDVPIIKGFSVMLYSTCLTNEVARISKLKALIDGKTNKTTRQNPRVLTRNHNAIVEFTANRPICVETFNDFKDFGRFIFRAGNVSIGAGMVTKLLS